jgi:hypothetical protein
MSGVGTNNHEKPSLLCLLKQQNSNLKKFPYRRALNHAQIDWLQTRKLCYWGGIDTHGVAILNQFREHFTQTA